MTEEMSKKSHPPTSFTSLPYDVALNCLARISRFHYPTLSLVSKGFRSLLSSPDLEATRSFIGKPENHLCVCLKLNNNPNPCWFTVSPIPKQKLKPIPSFPHQYPQSPTVISIGSEIYIIGGFVMRKRSRRVFLFDCRSHQWRRLSKMRLPRAAAAADVIKGKINVIGGTRSKNIENWGEVYDPKTNTWKFITSDFNIQNNMVLLVCGKVYGLDGLKVKLQTNVCLVKIEKALWLISVSNGNLFWREPKEGSENCRVNGLEQVSSNHFLSVVNSDRGGRVTVWWKSMTKFCVFHLQDQDCHSTEEFKTHIWCAEISFERRRLDELWGFVEWSKKVFTFDGFDPSFGFFLNSAIVTY